MAAVEVEGAGVVAGTGQVVGVGADHVERSRAAMEDGVVERDLEIALGGSHRGGGVRPRHARWGVGGGVGWGSLDIEGWCSGSVAKRSGGGSSDASLRPTREREPPGSRATIVRRSGEADQMSSRSSSSSSELVEVVVLVVVIFLVEVDVVEVFFVEFFVVSSSNSSSSSSRSSSNSSSSSRSSSNSSSSSSSSNSSSAASSSSSGWRATSRSARGPGGDVGDGASGFEISDVPGQFGFGRDPGNRA